ncbi:hypothetical protein PPERSA_04864 [Pseudocohnilembus persalinus]|uniref:Uncharacterized protein n=1 Tax=Pseudocohnilembus persalinus TaxID=266149 RepID=A0A0V0QJ34_PSEPJ|nr:hypothetical protein PPERSA_04864 [Pseudocohnilembus persalinus]|eukprot:KRX02242.1 hypothetical protein PPERSA_04864 [Pseudocohnilembus persalinus]
MLKFYATGEGFQKDLQPTRFINRMGAPDQSAKLNQRNYLNGDTKDFKEPNNKKHLKQSYSQSFNLRNQGKEGKYYEKQYQNFDNQKSTQSQTEPNYMRPLKKQFQKPDITYEREQFLNEGAIHLHDWELIKKRQYAFSRNFMPRENFYRTKPLLRLDNDFKEKPLIKNVQTISEDTPSWCQFTNQYYDPEKIDVTKKAKKQTPIPSNIFGVPLKKYNNNFMFRQIPQLQDYRSLDNKYEKRMITLDKDQYKKELQQKNWFKDSRKSQVNIGWEENPQKQKYEPKLTQKLFANHSTPYIKKLDDKRNNKLEIPNKIGSNGFQPKDRDIKVQLKIGHGKPETINPVKYAPTPTDHRIF